MLNGIEKWTQPEMYANAVFIIISYYYSFVPQWLEDIEVSSSMKTEHGEFDGLRQLDDLLAAAGSETGRNSQIKWQEPSIQYSCILG